jgi:hypothetical protein
MFVESIEAERLKTLIEDKKRQLPKLISKRSQQLMQKEILFLQEDILPVVETGTQILFLICQKHFGKVLNKAVSSDCDGFIVYYPLKDNFSEVPKIAINNCKDSIFQDGHVYISVYEVENSQGTLMIPDIIPLVI